MTKTSFLPHPIPAAAMIFISLGIAVAASTSFASTVIDVSDLPITCAVELDDKGRMVEIVARMATEEAITGTYSLEIAKSGNGGSSMIRQGGPFDLAAGETVTLGSSRMSGDLDQFNIDLTLNWNGMTLNCPSVEL